MLTLGNDNRHAPSFHQNDIHHILIPDKVPLTIHRTHPQILKYLTTLDHQPTIPTQAIPFAAMLLDK